MLRFGFMSSSARRILIVDDEPGIRKLLAIGFSRAGYAVRVASSGPDAIRICESEEFDVLLSDIMMPGMNGHELVRRLVRHAPKMRRILMSGFDGTRCEGCGFAPAPCLLLQKPFAPREAVALADFILADEAPEMAALVAED
jgi:DNA-binding response OmpR family regulator